MADKAFAINLVGFRRMLRDLNNLERREGRKIVTRAATAAGKLVVAEMKKRMQSISPGRYGTGRLAAAAAFMKVRPGKRSRVRIARVISMPTREQYGTSPSDKFFPPAVLEYGHPKPGREHAAPRSWFRSGYDVREKEAAGLMENTIMDGLRKFWRKAT